MAYMNRHSQVYIHAPEISRSLSLLGMRISPSRGEDLP